MIESALIRRFGPIAFGSGHGPSNTRKIKKPSSLKDGYFRGTTFILPARIYQSKCGRAGHREPSLSVKLRSNLRQTPSGKLSACGFPLCKGLDPAYSSSSSFL